MPGPAPIDEHALARQSVTVRHGARTDIVLLCEHAGADIPAPWGLLGLREELLRTHFALDLGAGDIAGALAAGLDCPLVLARYSRLFCDINRQTPDWEFCRVDMGGIPVPANRDISEAERHLRDRIARQPFDAAVRAVRGPAAKLVAFHSFSPVFDGRLRQIEIGVLHDGASTFGPTMIAFLRRIGGFTIGDNQPYDMRVAPPGTLHRVSGGQSAHVLAIEIRNDVATESGRRPALVNTLATALRLALARVTA